MAHVWGSGANDVWAVGALGVATHWDGSQWRSSATGVDAALTDVRGTSARDVWAVGAGGTILHWDGERWTSIPSGTQADLATVWAAAPDDAWAGGSQATLVHWNGQSWAPAPNAPGSDIVSIDGTSGSDVWLAGSGFSFVHWDGAAFHPVTLPIASPTSFIGVRAVDASDVFVTTQDSPGTPYATYRWDGQSWNALPDQYEVLWASGADDVWGTNVSNFLAHYDGKRWSVEVRDPYDQPTAPTAIWGTSARDVWEFEVFSPRHFDGAAWSVVATDSVEANVIWTAGGWSPTPDEVWTTVLTDKNIASVLRFDGDTVSEIRGFHLDDGQWNAVAGTSASDVWVVGFIGGVPGSGLIGHWNGVDGTVTKRQKALNAVWAASPTDAWAAGEDLEHWDGHAWSAVDLGSNSSGGFFAIVGTRASDVWVLGGPSSFHWDGAAWTAKPGIGVISNFGAAAWVADGALLVATGAGIQRLTDTGWMAETLPLQVFDMRTVWGSAPDDVWAGGAYGTSSGIVLHYDGKAWSKVPSLADDPVQWLAGSGGHTWAGVATLGGLGLMVRDANGL
jgi:hypothetical protein